MAYKRSNSGKSGKANKPAPLTEDQKQTVSNILNSLSCTSVSFERMPVVVYCMVGIGKNRTPMIFEQIDPDKYDIRKLDREVYCFEKRTCRTRTDIELPEDTIAEALAEFEETVAEWYDQSDDEEGDGDGLSEEEENDIAVAVLKDLGDEDLTEFFKAEFDAEDLMRICNAACVTLAESIKDQDFQPLVGFFVDQCNAATIRRFCNASHAALRELNGAEKAAKKPDGAGATSEESTEGADTGTNGSKAGQKKDQEPQQTQQKPAAEQQTPSVQSGATGGSGTDEGDDGLWF